MGLLSTSSTVVRFVATPPARLDRDAVARAVARRAFRELDPEGGDAAQAAGWVGIHDPLATDFSPADLFFQRWLAVGFRWDRRAVPAKLLWLERRRAEAAAHPGPTGALLIAGKVLDSRSENKCTRRTHHPQASSHVRTQMPRYPHNQSRKSRWSPCNKHPATPRTSGNH